MRNCQTQDLQILWQETVPREYVSETRSYVASPWRSESDGLWNIRNSSYHKGSFSDLWTAFMRLFRCGFFPNSAGFFFSEWGRLAGRENCHKVCWLFVVWWRFWMQASQKTWHSWQNKGAYQHWRWRLLDLTRPICWDCDLGQNANIYTNTGTNKNHVICCGVFASTSWNETWRNHLSRDDSKANRNTFLRAWNTTTVRR